MSTSSRLDTLYDLDTYDQNTITQLIQRGGKEIENFSFLDTWVTDVYKFLIAPRLEEIGEKSHYASKNMLNPSQILNNQFGSMVGSQVYEAGYTGSRWKGQNAGNDCLIHSILGCTSKIFRGLTTNRDRNMVASLFRRGILPLWFPDGTKSDTIKTIRERNFLSQDTGYALCVKLKLNCLWINSTEKGENTAVFNTPTFNESNKMYTHTICIYGSGAHFQPVMPNSAVGFGAVPFSEGSFVLKGFDGRAYMKQYFPMTLATFNTNYAEQTMVRVTEPYLGMDITRPYWIVDIKRDNSQKIKSVSLYDASNPYPKKTSNTWTGFDWKKSFRDMNFIEEVPIQLIQKVNLRTNTVQESDRGSAASASASSAARSLRNNVITEEERAQAQFIQSMLNAGVPRDEITAQIKLSNQFKSQENKNMEEAIRQSMLSSTKKRKGRLTRRNRRNRRTRRRA